MSEPVTPLLAVPARHPDDYFAQIAQWTAKGSKHFETMTDATSGHNLAMRLESWREFTSLLESDFFNRHDVQLVFRGHRRYGRSRDNPGEPQMKTDAYTECRGVGRIAQNGRPADHYGQGPVWA
ncbi:MAG: hypothetical protein JJ714_07890 [Acidithiobacillus sp.]|nr:hypothetical protein [Acidithiobacillus sp.]